jgi:hypothetical protein
MIRRMRSRRLARAALGLAAALTLAACTAGGQAKTTTSPQASVRPSPTRPAGPLVLDATQAGWRLPTPLQRAVALADGGRLLVLGGLTGAGVSTTAVLTVDPARGGPTRGPALSRGVHDAAGALLGGKMIMFGGGAASSVATVQQAGGGVIGELPMVRSDLAAATVGSTAYLVGGYDGITPRRDVLATTDGKSFRQVATLPQGVRYPAVAALGRTIYVIGGELASGASTPAIEALDTATGQARTLGRLLQPVSQASAVVLNGQLFVAGGMNGQQPTDKIWRIDPTSGTATSAGLLPYAVADAAAAVVGGHGYLVGGTGSGGATLDTIVTLTARVASPIASNASARPGRLALGSDPSVLPGPVLIADEDNNQIRAGLSSPIDQAIRAMRTRHASGPLST